MSTLVTKLKAIVNNDNLQKLGILPIYFDLVETPTALGQGFTITTNGDVLLKTENAHLTSSSLNDNLGTEATLNGIGTARYISNAEGAVANVMNKYNLQKITLRGGALNNSNRGQVKHIHTDISLLEYSPITMIFATNTSCVGDITKAFHRNSVIQYAELDDTYVTGDISVFNGKSALKRLYLNYTPVAGDVSGVMALPALQELKVGSRGAVGAISGDMASVSSSSLETLYMMNGAITGSIEFLNNLSALKSAEMYACTELTGNIENLRLASTCTKLLFRSNDKITGSKATCAANNPNCTFDWAGCSGLSA